jgi:hypothetical protein
MKGLIEVPRAPEIQDAPETAILAVLEHALLVASTTLMVEHPPIGQVSECYEGRVPPRNVLLAQLIVDRCTELSELICWYRRSCPRALTNHSLLADDFGEQEPF